MRRLILVLAGPIIAVAIVAMPGLAAAAEGGVGPAERDLLVRLRLASLWQVPAGQLALKQASSSKVIDVGEKIAKDQGDVDELVRSVAGELGIGLPNQPDAERREWLAELASARGEEFDRVLVDRLRTENSKLFSVIAGVRAGTRNPVVRSLSTSVNETVLRHMSYLDSTGLVNFVTLPAPAVDGVADDAAATGSLRAADRELLIRMRLAALWGGQAGQLAQDRASDLSVQLVGEKIATECEELAEVVRTMAASLGVTVPERPDAEREEWLAEIASAPGGQLDRAFVDRLRADYGSLLPMVAGVRSGTRNAVVRSFAAKANATVVRHMGYVEATGLVDFDRLPPPPVPEGQRTNGLERGGGVHPAVIWLVLASAGLVGVVTLARSVILSAPNSAGGVRS